MDKIIEKLYKLHLEEEQFPFGVADKESMQKECEVYCMLAQTLPQPMREQLSEYSALNEERHQSELQAAYEYGFKTAIKLVLESLKD